jgi:hypothetical protein
MAIWQYDLRVIPRSGLSQWLSTDVPIMPSQVDNESLEQTDWWKLVKPESVSQVLSTLLPQRPVGWDARTVSWGSEDGHRIDLVRDGGRVEELLVRIDVRSLLDGFLPRLLGALEDLGCLLVTETRRIIEPNAEALWNELRQSSAWRYVEDPEGLVATLSAEIAKKRRH